MDRPRVLVDIGGTWTRIRKQDTKTRILTPSIINFPGEHPSVLLDKLKDLLLEAAPTCPGEVLISLGAATDDLEGTVQGSGPLWGDWKIHPDSFRSLQLDRPDVTWSIYNDIACAAADLAVNKIHHSPYIAYITVSTGIGMKVIDIQNMTIWVDDDGMQGEIGHLSIPDLNGTVDTSTLRCPCGQVGHLSAVSAGPAIALVAQQLGVQNYSEKWFETALELHDPLALRLIDEVTRPLAYILRTIMVINSQISQIFIGGGVAEALGSYYLDSLYRYLGTSSGYGSPTSLPGQIVITEPNEIDPLRGVQLLAEGTVVIRKINKMPALCNERTSTVT